MFPIAALSRFSLRASSRESNTGVTGNPALVNTVARVSSVNTCRSQLHSFMVSIITMGHFTVLCLVPWRLSGSKAVVDYDT